MGRLNRAEGVFFERTEVEERDSAGDALELKDLVAGGTENRVLLETLADELLEFHGVASRDLVELSLGDFPVEALHVVGAEGGFETGKFIEYAPHAPDICLLVVGGVFPDLRGSVVGRACLSARHLVTFSDLGNIEVTQFDFAEVFAQKNIG